MSVFNDVLEEAHVSSHWKADFRKKWYGELGAICSFLPKSAPTIVAVSTTLSSQVRRDVLWVLQYYTQNYVNIDVGNDRPKFTLNFSSRIAAIQSQSYCGNTHVVSTVTLVMCRWTDSTCALMEREDIFFLQRTLSTPAHISSLAFGHAGHLFAGSGMTLHNVSVLANICQMMALFVSTISRHTKY